MEKNVNKFTQNVFNRRFKSDTFKFESCYDSNNS